MERVVLIGGGGHCKVVLDAILAGGEIEPIAVLDSRFRDGTAPEAILGVPVSGSDDDLERWREAGVELAIVTVGSLGDVTARMKLAASARAAGFTLATVVHPRAVVAPSARLGEGTFVAAGAVVNPDAVVGENCIVNTGALVDHDCRLGDFVHLAPGVALSGAAVVGDRSHVGTGSAVIQQARIGSDTIVGAGSVVVADIPSGVVAFGVPCELRRQRD